MKATQKKAAQKLRRHARIRAKVSGTSKTPRLSVFKSNKYISAQLIDDEKGVTLASSSSKGSKGKTKGDKAREVGADIAKAAKTKKILKVVFDRGGFTYTGNIKTLAESARKGGLKF